MVLLLKLLLLLSQPLHFIILLGVFDVDLFLVRFLQGLHLLGVFTDAFLVRGLQVSDLLAVLSISLADLSSVCVLQVLDVIVVLTNLFLKLANDNNCVFELIVLVFEYYGVQSQWPLQQDECSGWMFCYGITTAAGARGSMNLGVGTYWPGTQPCNP